MRRLIEPIGQRAAAGGSQRQNFLGGARRLGPDLHLDPPARLKGIDDRVQLAEADAPVRFLASPMAIEGNSRGYVCLGRWEAGSVFLSPEQKLISALAMLMAVELENARLQRSELDKQRLVTELELARAIQQSLLPRDFSGTGFLEAAGWSEPCSEIGGDFFDLVLINKNVCTLVIADVSGKGPPAALQAAMVQGIVHAASRNGLKLTSLMVTLNECLLTRSPAGRFVTAFVATLNSKGRLHYSNGGHTLPLWIKADGKVIEVAEGGPLLGVFAKPRYSQGSAQLAAGDLLVLYTDGVTEAENSGGDRFGTARLVEWARHQAGRSPTEVRDSLIHTVSDFCAGKRRGDDRSVLVVRYRGLDVR